MPKSAMNYNNCCIYKIEHINDESLVYVGHTNNFKQRKSQHKSCCNSENIKNYNRKLYQMIRENGGWDMFKMIEVEKYPCNDKREAERRENEVMKELRANMNMRNSFVTEEEIKEYQKEYLKEYRVEKKEYYDEYMKEYYKSNKEKINGKKNEKVKCECGCEVAKNNLQRHRKIKKHLDKMNKKISR